LEKNILSISEPIVYSYKHHGLPLSIIQYNENTKFWILSRYINLYAVPNFDDVHWLDYFSQHLFSFHSPWIFPQRITKNTLLNVFGKIGFSEFVINCIDSGQYVYIEYDAYYIPHHSSFKRIHHISNLLVFGYDKGNNLFNILDYDYNNNMRFCEMQVKFADLADAYYNMDAPEYNAISVLSVSGADAQFTPDMSLIKQRLEGYLEGTDYLSNYRVAMNFHHGNSKGRVFGINIYDLLEEYIDSTNKGNSKLYIQPFSTLWEHKRVLQLLGESIIELDGNGEDSKLLSNSLQKMERMAMIIRNLCLKQKISKSVYFVNKIKSHLQELREYERSTLFDLINLLGKRI